MHHVLCMLPSLQPDSPGFAVDYGNSKRIIQIAQTWEEGIENVKTYFVLQKKGTVTYMVRLRHRTWPMSVLRKSAATALAI